MRYRTLLALVSTLAPLASAAAQGSNDCFAAQPIAGYATFPFDNGSATTDGGPNALCEKGGNQQIENDVWFAWTAPADESVDVTTCGLATIDTMLAVYETTFCGSAPILACDDDSGCDLQTRVSFDARAGTRYLIRIGNFPGSASGSGSFRVSVAEETVDCSPPSVGPDVIVGDIVDVVQYGTVDGKTAYAFGTDACNIGDSTMPWEAFTNQHPVISSNVYRLMGGRFEQIGMSWVKHGFGSATGNTCCDCQNPGNDQIMGIGCSDLYTAGLNGNQAGFAGFGGLGPRSEIDPSTGAFPFPHSGLGTSGDALFKRLQIAVSDLDPALNPGASYFVEAQYISPSDSAAGNGLNNVSFRPLQVVSFDGSGYEFGSSGFTRRTQPAILAWQEADPEVNVDVIDVPGDGRLYLASRATDQGGGTWRYEYALYNMNSRRAVRALSVPLAPGVLATGLDFHDVDSHSGEIYDSTDWTASISGGLPSAVSWRTESFAVDSTANALRWGTTYSFGFDAGAAPGEVSAQLELFLPGAPQVLVASAVGPVGSDDPGGAATCFGDGSDTHCPCDNESLVPGTGCMHSGGVGMFLTAAGSASLANDDLVLTAHGCPTGNTGLFYAGRSTFDPARHLFDGLQCATGDVLRFRGQLATDTTVSDSGFVAQDVFGLFWSPGTTVTFQYFSRDNQAGPSPCGGFANLSSGYALTMTP